MEKIKLYVYFVWSFVPAIQLYQDFSETGGKLEYDTVIFARFDDGIVVVFPKTKVLII